MKLQYHLIRILATWVVCGVAFGNSDIASILKQYRFEKSVRSIETPVRSQHPALQKAELLMFSGDYDASLKAIYSVDVSKLEIDDYVKMLEIRFHNYIELKQRKKISRQIKKVSRETKYLHFLQSEYIFDRLKTLLTGPYKKTFDIYAVNMLKNFPYTPSSRKSFQYLQECYQRAKIPFSVASKIARFSHLSPGVGDWLMDRLRENEIKYPRSSRMRLLKERLRLRLESINEYQQLIPDEKLEKFSRENMLISTLYARTHAKEKNIGQASALYRKFLKIWGKSSKTIPLWTSYAHFLARQGNFFDAAKEFRQILRYSRTRKNRWFAFWYTFKSEDYNKSLEVVNSRYMRSLDRQYPEMKYYWKARNFEVLGRTDLAWENDLKVLKRWGGGYYASLVLNRYSIEKSQDIIARNKTIRPISFVNISETFDARFWHNKQKKLNLRLPRSFTELLQSIGKKPEIWKEKYPRPYLSWVKKIEDLWGTNTAILYSIIRAESYYNSKAKSIVGARGLMQIMPYTGYSIAEEIGDNAFHQLDLMDPIISILYGGYYYSKLLSHYKGNIFYATAAYNAGPLKVNEWLNLCGSCTVDEFVESIPYKETRNYVKRVISSLGMYTRIYQNEAFPRFQISNSRDLNFSDSKLY